MQIFFYLTQKKIESRSAKSGCALPFFFLELKIDSLKADEILFVSRSTFTVKGVDPATALLNLKFQITGGEGV